MEKTRKIMQLQINVDAAYVAQQPLVMAVVQVVVMDGGQPVGSPVQFAEPLMPGDIDDDLLAALGAALARAGLRVERLA